MLNEIWDLHLDGYSKFELYMTPAHLLSKQRHSYYRCMAQSQCKTGNQQAHCICGQHVWNFFVLLLRFLLIILMGQGLAEISTFNWYFSPSLMSCSRMTPLWSQLCLSSLTSHKFPAALAQIWPGTAMKPTSSSRGAGTQLRPDRPTRALLPVWWFQDSVGTSFSAASVIPTGDLHLVSTARGHVSKAQMVVSGTQHLKRCCSCYPCCVLISGWL